MKLVIATAIVVIIGVGAVVGVYQFQESRMTPADLDALRDVERNLIEAEEAEASLDSDAPAETPDVFEMAQADEVSGPREWAQIDTPEYDPVEPFHVKFDCSMGDFVIEFQPIWAPNGTKRVHELVDMKYFDDCRFFRVIDGFMAQFGISGDPELSQEWSMKTIQDDPVKATNTEGYVTFAAGRMPNSRSTQMFINFGDNSRLDQSGFAPVGKVVDGMDAVKKIHSGYGGSPDEGGMGPRQDMINAMGNKYLSEQFPELDYIKKARFVKPVEAETEDAEEEAA